MHVRRVISPADHRGLRVARLTTAHAQTATAEPFEPTVGQAGKDVVWVPTPQTLVEKMLDIAKVTPKDYLIDLGSGDGAHRDHGRQARPDGERHRIQPRHGRTGAAQRRGGQGDATRPPLRKADLFETDFSKAQVITMFLLPSINMRLRPTILNMKPGTRIVTNTFTMEDWQADAQTTADGDCVSWCTAYLWIVPAKVGGTWQLGKRAR